MVEIDNAAEVLVATSYESEHGAYFSTPMVYKVEWRGVDPE